MSASQQKRNRELACQLTECRHLLTTARNEIARLNGQTNFACVCKVCGGVKPPAALSQDDATTLAHACFPAVAARENAGHGQDGLDGRACCAGARGAGEKP
jgi:hypothetical protein